MPAKTNKKSAPRVLRIIATLGNWISTVGLVLVLLPLFADKFVLPEFMAPVMKLLETYPKLPYAVFIGGFVMAFIPGVVSSFRSDKTPPTAEQLKAQAKIDEILTTDPVALKTQWTPQKSGGNSFLTHRVIAVDNSRIELKVSKGAIISLVGTVIMFGVFDYIFIRMGGGAEGLLVITIMFAIFAGAALYSLFKLLRPTVMDKNMGWFWHGYGLGNDVDKIAQHKNSVRLADVYAIQLMSETIEQQKSQDWASYEINLVLKDSSRVNVMDHNDWDSIVIDAQKIADFLNVKLWQKG